MPNISDPRYMYALIDWRWTMIARTFICRAVGALAMALAGSTAAESSPLAQAQAECQNIAQQQTGYNPSAASTTTQPQAGGRARGAAAGAMAGAAKDRSKANQYGNVSGEVAEEYTRNQMEDAAKMGAAAGASRQRQQRREDRRGQQQESSAANVYNQAYSSCMAAKGFPGQ